MGEDLLVLALNPGSSSVKAALRAPAPVLSLTVDRLGSPAGELRVEAGGQVSSRPFPGGPGEVVDAIAAELRDRRLAPDAVAHRVVHGGPRHHAPTVIDDGVLDDLRAVIPLAPLHLPGGIDSIVRSRAAWPGARHVACFDTEFHHDLPAASRELPVAAELRAAGVRRYGFHGLSVRSVLRAHPDLGGTVVAHLGSGCSVTAVAADGRPVHTTMSLTPTGGMMSATRTGDLDPEIVLHLLGAGGYTVERLRELFDRRSGLAGIAGGRHDLRDLLAAGDAQAAAAVEMFVRAAAAAVAGCASALDRWDSLVFTGGIGASSGPVRERICARLLAARGVDGAGGGAVDRLGRDGCRVLAVRCDEESELDRGARDLLAGRGGRAPGQDA